MEDHDDGEYVASEHDRLVSAITKLDKTQHITEPTRNEPTNQNSEFNLIKWSNKLNLDNVIKVLEDTAKNVKIGKKLKKTQDAKKILPKPLEKPQAERIKRSTGYEQTKKKVGRWDSVVARNRTVDFVSFPIKTSSNKLQPTDVFLSKLKLKSSLEKELEEVDPQPEVEMQEEDEPIYPMSYQEMLEHRENLAKFRAQQSYKAAKAKRQSKIKSKKYHRILKKERLKQQLKEFEELQSKDPEQALKKLEELEKARALERHTLRHKNTGKWAKSKLVRAKYDKEVRQQLAEQLSVSKGLTQKVQNVESSDDEADDEIVPDITLDQDPMNPWMMKRSDKTNIDAEFDFGYKKYLKDKMYKRQENIDSESDEEQEKINSESHVSLASLRESVKRLSNNVTNESVAKEIPVSTYNKDEEPNEDKLTEGKSKKRSKAVATSDWMVESIDNQPLNKKLETKSVDLAFDNFESKVASKVEKQMKKLKKQISKLEKQPNEKKFNKEQKSKDTDNLEYLKLKNRNLKPIIDEELIETHKGEVINDITPKSNVNLNINETPTEDTSNMNIDPSRFIEVKPKYLNTAVSKEENGIDDLDDEEQVVPKVDIEEVFEEDDVVASFRQEKEDEINKDMPQEIDLSLPGWGSWGGKGVKPSKRKKNRFITNAPPKMPRRDENKGDIIINEIKNPKLSVHKVSDVPFPFTSVREYEASIRTPLGNTFIPETAHKKLIRPSVITKAGTIIDPMDEDELLVKRNLTFKNESVIKLLAKK